MSLTPQSQGHFKIPTIQIMQVSESRPHLKDPPTHRYQYPFMCRHHTGEKTESQAVPWPQRLLASGSTFQAGASGPSIIGSSHCSPPSNNSCCVPGPGKPAQWHSRHKIDLGCAVSLGHLLSLSEPQTPYPTHT
jgi:hypothetical protein